MPSRGVEPQFASVITNAHHHRHATTPFNKHVNIHCFVQPAIQAIKPQAQATQFGTTHAAVTTLLCSHNPARHYRSISYHTHHHAQPHTPPPTRDRSSQDEHSPSHHSYRYSSSRSAHGPHSPSAQPSQSPHTSPHHKPTISQHSKLSSAYQSPFSIFSNPKQSFPQKYAECPP